jgi:diguanylate cyclase (GGDEF)-like protein
MYQGAEVTVTLSCGIAAYPTYKTVSEIIKAADKALYDAKKAGRNRVMAAG